MISKHFLKVFKHETETKYFVIVPDDDPISPIDDDNVCQTKFICFHRKYSLGHEHNYNSDNYSGWGEMKKAIYKQENPILIEPLSVYAHGGLTIYLGLPTDRWDSGRVGFAVVTKEMADGCGIDPKDIEALRKCMEADVAEYDAYLRGECYGYELLDVNVCDMGHRHVDVIDQCFGYIGDPSRVLADKPEEYTIEIPQSQYNLHF